MSFGRMGIRATPIGLLRSLTIRQSWTLAVALAAMIAATSAIGAWVQSARDGRKLEDAKQEIVKLTVDNDKLKSEKVDLKQQLGEANRLLEAEKSAVKAVAQKDQAIETKEKFLDKYLSYKIAGGDETRRLFTDYVCALWKASDERNVQVIKASLQLSDDDIRQGVSTDVRRMLIKSGLSESIVPTKFGPTMGVPHGVKRARASDDAISEIKKSATNIYLVKTIHFNDGTDYQIPQEIATAVYNNPSCAP